MCIFSVTVETSCSTKTGGKEGVWSSIGGRLTYKQSKNSMKLYFPLRSVYLFSLFSRENEESLFLSTLFRHEKKIFCITVHLWNAEPGVTRHLARTLVAAAVNHVNNSRPQTRTQWIHTHGQSAVKLSVLVSAVITVTTAIPLMSVYFLGSENGLTDRHRCANGRPDTPIN